MGKEPNTVKSNVVKGFMDFSEQDPHLELNSSDFQDEFDSTVLVRERARGSKRTIVQEIRQGNQGDSAYDHLPARIVKHSKIPVQKMWRWPQKDKVAKNGRSRATS